MAFTSPADKYNKDLHLVPIFFLAGKVNALAGVLLLNTTNNPQTPTDQFCFMPRVSHIYSTLGVRK